jgi:hypothetical protein
VRGERRKRKRARETATRGSYPLTRAAAIIRRVDGQGVDSELLPWTEEEDEAVEVGLGLFWASVWKGEGESWARLGPKQRREFFSIKPFLFYISFLKNCNIVLVANTLEIQTCFEI